MAKCDPLFEAEAELTKDDKAHIAFLTRIKWHIEGVTKDAALSDEMLGSLDDTIKMIAEDIHRRECFPLPNHPDFQVYSITEG